MGYRIRVKKCIERSWDEHKKLPDQIVIKNFVRGEDGFFIALENGSQERWFAETESPSFAIGGAVTFISLDKLVSPGEFKHCRISILSDNIELSWANCGEAIFTGIVVEVHRD